MGGLVVMFFVVVLPPISGAGLLWVKLENRFWEPGTGTLSL